MAPSGLLTRRSAALCSSFFTHTAPTEVYTLSLHDALPISWWPWKWRAFASRSTSRRAARSEEHTSELQSPMYLVCRLLLEKKKTSATLHGSPASTCLNDVSSSSNLFCLSVTPYSSKELH